MTHTPALAYARAHHATRALAGFVVAVLAIAATFGTGPATAAPAGTSCPRWTAVLVPGTWQTPTANRDQPAAILARIGQGLRQRYGSNISVHTLTYPAPDTSETEGVQALSTTLAGLCPSTQVALAGYSQGANIAGDIATSIGNNQGPLPAPRIAGVTLISDPRRNSSTPQLGQPAPGEGIAGPRSENFGTLAGRVRTLCAGSDIYCATSPQASPALAAVGRVFTGNTTAPDSDTSVPSPDQIPSPTPTPTDTSPATPNPTQETGSLNDIDPSEIIEQVTTVLSGLTGFAADIPAIINDLAQLPGLITSGNVPGLHQVSGDLNNQFAPLVQTAAQTDLHLVAQALALAAPLDTTGWTAIASQIVAIIANLDITRIATDIGQAQEIAWDALQKLTTSDPAGAALTLAGVIPVAGDLATTAASALTGDAGSHLARLAKTFTATTTPDLTTALGDLTRQGGDTARGATSSAHQSSYTTAFQPALAWLTSRIESAR